MAAGDNTTDFKFIDPEILELASRFVFTELAYDRAFVGEIVRNLQDEGQSLVESGQGFLSMGPYHASRNNLFFISTLYSLPVSRRFAYVFRNSPDSCR